MDKDSKIYIAGHRGLVGSAILRRLGEKGYTNIITRSHGELDLTEQGAVQEFLNNEKPEYVFLCAAKVGGILANKTYPAEFIHQNVVIQANIIHESYKSGVRRLLFLGSSCIYPRECPQPMKEEYLLTGSLEQTNRPYAVAKIAGIEMCWAYNRQYRTQYLAIMPTNLYGPGDNYDLENSHVLPALIRKMHEAKLSSAQSVSIWGTGKPMREFLYSDDLGDAAVFLMDLADKKFATLLGTGSTGLSLRSNGSAPSSITPQFSPPLINIGVGKEISIKELALLVRDVVGYTGKLFWDSTKPDGTPRKLLDVDKITELGWTYRTSLKDGIKKVYKEYQQRVNRDKPVQIQDQQK
ncbi:MAG: GDP-L-fucose synthase [Acidiferrobacterales bacterium]